ncbi:MAG TPA: tetratricopeptide repeat protein [Thermomonas sp.]|nr:tetratricopeptide repeat protein [Thermomonas sp.]
MARDDGLLIKPEPRKPWVYGAVAGAVLALLAAGYFAFGMSGTPTPAPGPAPASIAPATSGQLPAIVIAVLPLATAAPAAAGADAQGFAEGSSESLVDALKVDANPAQDFNDGLSEQLVGALSQFAGVAVTSPESSFQQRDPEARPATIGKALGATHLLKGSASRIGDELRIDAALVSVADGSTLWFERYQRPYRELFKVQDEMATAVGAALKVKRLPAPQGAQDERPPAGRLDAYEALLAGDAAIKQGDAEHVLAAISAYERAIAADGGYGHAHARLALARIQLATRFPAQAGDIREAGERARREAATALRLAPDSADAHAANAAWLGSIALDQAGALAETERALAIRPQDASLLHVLAIRQTAFGRLEEAAATLRRALALNPLSATALYNLGGIYLGMNDYAEAEHVLGRALALRPDLSVVRAFQAIAIFQQNRAPEAIGIARDEPDPLWKAYALAMAYWANGERDRSDAELQVLVRDAPEGAATQIAGIYAQRDDEAAMFKWLQAARDAGDPGIVEIRYMPFVSRYAEDPRFIALLRELDLVQDVAKAPAGKPAASR